jgi:hypothetical protein
VTDKASFLVWAVALASVRLGCTPRPSAPAPPDLTRAPVRARPAPAGAAGFETACTPRLQPERGLFAGAAGRGSFAVQAGAGCTFRARSAAGWITLAGAPAGGRVDFTLAPNPGPDRMGVIDVEDVAFVVVQRGRGPEGGHPRLWIRAADVESLRRRAVGDNPMWSRVIVPRTEEANRAYEQSYFPGGKPARPWPDPGASGGGGKTESVALQLAFYALVAPDAGARDRAARRARDLLMYVMAEIDAGGPATGFRAERFPVGDRFRYAGEQWALVVDWLYERLTAADLAVIRRVFLRWAEMHATHSEQYRPRTLFADPALVKKPLDVRWMANNWQTAMARNLLLESLVLDDQHDPPVDSARPVLAPKNSLRAYRREALASLLYQQYHLFRRGGDAWGGIPPEGAFAYGSESSAFLFHGLLALVTAGYTDWERWGEQVTLVGDRYLRDMVAYYPHGIAPAPEQREGEAEGQGRAYAAAMIEQTRGWAMAGYIHVAQLAPVGVIAALTGDVLLRDRVRWLLTEPLPGGPALREKHAGYDASHSVLSFLLHDPRLPAPHDYREELPPTFYAPALGRISSRTGWGAQASWLSTSCTWKTIDHQIDLCGSFLFWRKGDWITDPRNGYSDTGVIDSPDYQNALAVQKLAGPRAAWETVVWQRGGQTRYNQGDPATRVSDAPDVLFVESDATNLHNQTDAAPEAPHVSRALCWLKPDVLVIYDRARTTAAGRWKRFWLNLPGKPAIEGAAVQARTRSGQQIRLDVLAPARAAIGERPWETDPGDGGGEQMVSHLSVEDPAAPADARVLTVLQAYDKGARALAAQALAVQGPAFQGAAVGDAVVLFAVAPGPQSAAGVGYAAPAGTRLHVISGLRPGDRYDVEIDPRVGAGARGGGVRIRAGGALTVDGAGVLVVRRR